jgi:hypothetical protein
MPSLKGQNKIIIVSELRRCKGGIQVKLYDGEKQSDPLYKFNLGHGEEKDFKLQPSSLQPTSLLTEL